MGEGTNQMDIIKIGLIGAGTNMVEKHIPGFLKIPGVEIVAVANRTKESAQKVAQQFNIPYVFDNWIDLLKKAPNDLTSRKAALRGRLHPALPVEGATQAPIIDAICIGTWPNTHCEMTVASLNAGKHVLCEARMSRNLAEAKKMLSATKKRKNLVAQLVPAPYSFAVDQTICDFLKKGKLGSLYAVDLNVTTQNFADFDSPLHWRQDKKISGFNIMTMGIWYESLLRWGFEASLVTSLTNTVIRHRKDKNGKDIEIFVPDHTEITYKTLYNLTVHLRFSSVMGLGPQNLIWIFGSEGTLLYNITDSTLFYGKRGDKALKPVSIPEKKRGVWRVEEEFIASIRGQEKVKLTTFEDGVKYMAFTEAVHDSTKTKKAVSISSLL